MIKTMAGSCVSAWLPAFFVLKMNEPFLLDTLDDNLWSDKEKEGTR